MIAIQLILSYSSVVCLNALTEYLILFSNGSDFWAVPQFISRFVVRNGLRIWFIYHLFMRFIGRHSPHHRFNKLLNRNNKFSQIFFSKTHFAIIMQLFDQIWSKLSYNWATSFKPHFTHFYLIFRQFKPDFRPFLTPFQINNKNLSEITINFSFNKVLKFRFTYRQWENMKHENILVQLYSNSFI